MKAVNEIGELLARIMWWRDAAPVSTCFCPRFMSCAATLHIRSLCPSCCSVLACERQVCGVSSRPVVVVMSKSKIQKAGWCRYW